MTESELPALPAHLISHRTERGFAHLPWIIDDTPNPEHRTTVKVYESSSADGPHVWLALEGQPNPQPTVRGVTAHLHAHAAWQVAEQLMHTVLDHYQGAEIPDDTYYNVVVDDDVEDAPERVDRAAQVMYTTVARTPSGAGDWKHLEEEDKEFWRHRVGLVVHALVADDDEDLDDDVETTEPRSDNDAGRDQP